MEPTSVMRGHRESGHAGGLADLGHDAWTALRRLILPAAVLAGVMVLLGLLLTKVLDTTWVSREDAQLSRDLVAERNPDGNFLTGLFTTLAQTPTIVALTAVAAVAFRLVFKRWRESVIVVSAVVGETLIFWLTTLLIDRRRPAVPELDPAPPTSSYPSGHTAAAVAFYGTVAVIVLWHTRRTWLRWLAVTVAFLVPLAVGASRLYRGMHFPTDVLAGLLLGYTWLATVVTLLRPGDRVDRR
jgi:membrane-associated phospholipid phosphatase